MLPEFVIGQRLSIFEDDWGLTLVTGALPAVVSAVVIGQRLRTFEGDRWLTLITGAFPAVVTVCCDCTAPSHYLRVTGG